MKFLFCGDSNCPEWLLAESALLTKIAAVKMKLVTQYIIQYMVNKEDQSAKIFKMLESSGFNQQEINSIIASITYIIENATKYDVNDQTLTKELIDLGLPKENCEQLSKTFKQWKEQLQVTFQQEIFRGKKWIKQQIVSKLTDFKYGMSKFIVSDNVIPMRQIAGNKYIDVHVQVDNKPHNFVIMPDMLIDMFNSFKKAQNIMMQY